MNTTPATIVRIVSVVDTRDAIEIDDRWVKLPGTGQIRECTRCARDHEIHVTVELSDGDTAVIGSGCAKGESLEIRAAIKSAVSAAKTRTRLAAELTAAEREIDTAAAIWATVDALPVPGAPVLIEEIPSERGTRQVWALGDASVWVLPGCTFNDERRAALANSWRDNRYRELGGVYVNPNKVGDLKDRLAKIDRKIAGLTGAN